MSLSGAVPKHATYIQGGLPVGLDSKRRTIRLVPQTGTGEYSPDGSNIIRLDIPNSIGFLDTQNSYLRFRVKVDGAKVDMKYPCYMDKNSMSWVDRFEVISNNGSVLESIHDYNLLVNLLHKATSPDDYRLTTGKLLDNQGTRAERGANLFSKSGRLYCAGLDASGIFGGNTKYLPCQFIEGALTLEFSLASFSDCFVGVNADNATATYTIYDVEYIAEAISFGQDFNYLFEQQLRTAGIDIAFHSYRSHHHALQSGSDQVIQLSQNSKSVKGVYVVMRDISKYRSANYESLSEYKSGQLNSYQLDLGGRLFPEFPINVANQGQASAFASNLNSFNHFRDQSTGSEITRDTFAPEGGGKKVNTGNALTTFNMPCVESYWGFLFASSKANQEAMYGFDSATPVADNAGSDGKKYGINYVSEQTNGDELVVEAGLYFRPCDCRELKDIKLGDRYKLNFADATFTADNNLKRYYDKLSNNLEPNGYRESGGSSDGGFLWVTGVGMTIHRQSDQGVMESIPGCVQLSKMADGCDSKNMSNKSSLTRTSAAGEGALNQKNVTSKMAVPVLPARAHGAKDAANNDLVAGRSNSLSSLCFIQKVPDDTNYYIGQSFETHEEHETMISGMDTTNVVPLHINLKFGGGTNNDNGQGEYYNAVVKQGDLLTAFLHYDAVLRIEPDGSCVSSM